MLWPVTGLTWMSGADLASARVTRATVLKPPDLDEEALMLMLLALAGIGKDFELPGATYLEDFPTL